MNEPEVTNRFTESVCDQRLTALPGPPSWAPPCRPPLCRCLTVCCISSFSGLFRPVPACCGHNAGHKDGAAEAIWVVQVSSCGKRHGGLRRPQAGQRLTMSTQLVEVRIGPPDGELPVDGDGFLARDQDLPASPERPGGSTCCQRGAAADRKLAALIPACFLADFQHSQHRRP